MKKSFYSYSTRMNISFNSKSELTLDASEDVVTGELKNCTATYQGVTHSIDGDTYLALTKLKD